MARATEPELQRRTGRSTGQPGLLVASPRLDASVFARTVIFLCEYTPEGAMGLVVNRGLGISIGEVMEQLEIEHTGASFKETVLWGGPVEPAAGLVICRTQNGTRPDGCLASVEGTNLCVSASRLILEAIAQERWRGPYHLCLGYAGWGPGQLDREIAEGSWLVSELDESLLFGVPLGERWEHLVSSLGVGQQMMWIPPIQE